MLNLITGRPGHGKNIYCLHWLEKNGFIVYDKDSEKFHTFIDRPLFFIAFHDIDILDATTAQYEDLNDLPTRQDGKNESIFPDDSVIVIDEAHLYSPKSSNKEGFTDFVSFLKVHRHFGFDFVFITQSQKDLNIDIRNLVENHYRVNRPFGTNKSFYAHYMGCETTENKNPIKQSSGSFQLDKRFFKIYKSASLHNYKSSIPKKYYVFILLFFIFVWFIGTRLLYVFNIFTDENSTGIPGISSPAISGTAGPSIRPKNNKFLPYLYNFKNNARLKDYHLILKGVNENIFIDVNSIFCYCSSNDIKILDKLVRLIDKSVNVKIDFTLISFSERDFLDYSLSYSFDRSGFFRFNKTGELVSNLLFFDYLERDYKSITKITSSALVELGHTFKSSFVTQYPVILEKSITGQNSETKDESLSFNDVGFNFEISTDFITDDTIAVNLAQSHSLLAAADFVNGVPVRNKRDFKSRFLLKDKQLIPLFNLSSALTSSNKTNNIPFLSLFMPANKDKDKSVYQVFLKFEFSNAGLGVSDISKIKKKLKKKTTNKKINQKNL